MLWTMILWGVLSNPLGDGWQVVREPDFVFNGEKVFLVDSLAGWIMGSEGTVLRTLDGGRTWEDRSPGGYEEYTFFGGFFWDSLKGFVVGSGGVILQTYDGGRNWVERTRLPHTLKSIWFPDSLHGWAAGGNGGIWYTPDGGVTWIPQSSPTTQTLEAVWFSDSLSGRAVGGIDVFLRTEDGGQTWLLGGIGAGIRLYDLSFVDAQYGYVAAYGGRIFATEDGGETWELRSTLYSGNAVLTGIHFLDPLQGWACGSQGWVFHTRDGGVTWDTLLLGTGELLSALAFSSPRHGVVLSFNGTPYYTEDGGENWEPGVSWPAVYWYSIGGWSPQVVIAGGYGGAFTRSEDGGITFTFPDNRFVGTNAHLLHLITLPGGEALFLGGEGTILRSPDLGQTWIPVSSPVSKTFRDVAFPDPRYGYAVTTDTLLVTWDGGETWLVRAALDNLFIDHVAFRDSLTGLLSSAIGFYRTTDGGFHWTWVSDLGGEHVADLEVDSSGVFWAATSGGNLWRSSDLGQTWELRLVSFPRFFDLAFRGDRAIALCDDGVAWVSQDGGETWERIEVGLSLPLRQAFFWTDQVVWVVALRGTILRYEFPYMVGEGPFLKPRQGKWRWSASDKLEVYAPPGSRLSLFDIAGRRVWTGRVSTDGEEVPFPLLQGGVYFLRLEWGKGELIWRILYLR